MLKHLGRIPANLVLRTSRGPLRPLWTGLHRALIRSVSRFLARPPGTAVYLRGSFADGEGVPGLSDIDLTVVAADPRAARRRLRRMRSTLDALVWVTIYDAGELEAVAAETIFSQPEPVFAKPRPMSLRIRPGLAGATRDWALLRGPDLRPAASGSPDPCVVAWLELQCWWRYAMLAAAHPADRLVPYLCFKLVAEFTRTWLWLAHGELVRGRVAALRRGLDLMPEDEAALRNALTIHEALHRRPDVDLDGTFGWLVDMSERFGALVDKSAAERPGTIVRLEPGGPRPADRLPLMDWRALAVPEAGPREVILSEGDPRRAADLAAADRADRAGIPHLLRGEGVFFIPSGDLESKPLARGTLRIVQCAASDPVTTALLEGRDEARFSDIPGWRAVDWATRAKAERGDGAFLESLERGEPALHVG